MFSMGDMMKEMTEVAKDMKTEMTDVATDMKDSATDMKKELDIAKDSAITESEDLTKK
jgi:ribosome recycling factor